MNFGIDLDGVCYSFSDSFNDWLQKRIPGYELPNKEITSYYWYETNKTITKEQFFKEFDQFGYAGEYERLKDLPGAFDGLRRIAEAGHNIFYVTNRPLYAYDSTVAALRNADLPFRYNLIFACGKKSPWVNALKLNFFIEDSPSTITEIVQNSPGCSTYCVDYPYNRAMDLDPATYTRIKNFGEFVEATL